MQENAEIEVPVTTNIKIANNKDNLTTLPIRTSDMASSNLSGRHRRDKTGDMQDTLDEIAGLEHLKASLPANYNTENLS